MSNVFVEKCVRVVCPHCGTPGSTVDHLKEGQSFGPWYCDSCNKSYTGEIVGGGVVLEKHESVKTPLVVLLKMGNARDKDVFILVNGMTFDDPTNKQDVAEGLEYFYNEHTCPWNYLNVPIREGWDSDPHGLFVYVDHIIKPSGFDDLDFHEQFELFEMFKEDK